MISVKHQPARDRSSVLGILVLLSLACSGTSDVLHGRLRANSSDLEGALAGDSRTSAQRGMIRFLYDDLGGLRVDGRTANALPWKLVVAALVLQRNERLGRRAIDRGDLPAVFAEFGLVIPDEIENWPGGHTPMLPKDRPVGMVTGIAAYRVPSVKVQIGNVGCASCHAGVTYDSSGMPTRRLWLGLPNSSVNLQGFATAAYRALKSETANRARLLAAVDTLFPDIDARERRSLERLVIPRVDKRIRELASTIDAPSPFDNGGPGHTNGAAAMKYQLSLVAADRMAPDAGFVSVPDLAHRELRSSLLADGGYAVPGQSRFVAMTPADVTTSHTDDLARIVALFAVPVMGIRIEDAPHAIPAVEEMMGFLRTYRPPPFPGTIDTTLALAGASAFAARCSGCHGEMADDASGRVTITRYPNRLVRQSDIGTDRARLETIDAPLISALRASGYSRYIDVDSTGGYVAPQLGGVWATAPYLHDGSIPTLWHLMHPSERPSRFELGGHRLDFTRVGIAGETDSTGTMRYPAGYKPWSIPFMYDTHTRGRGNAGHTRPFDRMSEEEKRAVVEYMKRF